MLLGLASTAKADLEYAVETTEEGLRFVMVHGRFSHDDDLSQFSQVVRSHDPNVVVFESPGGNVFKAIELGRLIRALGLSTLQIRSAECSSACALAFLGGVHRIAEPGSIGVHRSSFGDASQFSAEEAVAKVQELTAMVMTYMVEMGADPGLMQLSLQYDARDMRYLSGSEMERYRVVTIGEAAVASSEESRPQAPSIESRATPEQGVNTLGLPDARTGRVLHPKGQAPLKAAADGDSANLANLRNGATLAIVGNDGRWYRVQAGTLFGYLHHTWVYVDQFEGGPYGRRHIQIKSFDNLDDAYAFIRGSSLPLAAYLATNGWFAVTLEDTYEQAAAVKLVRRLKEQGAIPLDSFMTYGTTYARKVCCE